MRSWIMWSLPSLLILLRALCWPYTSSAQTNIRPGPINSNDNFAFMGGQNTLNTDNVNNVIVVDGHTSIASAIRALPSTGGIIHIPSANSPYSVALGTLNISKPIRFVCEDPTTTVINFTGISGVAFLFNYTAIDQKDQNTGIENCQIIGPGGYAGGIRNSGTFIQIGDSTHSPTGVAVRNSLIAGFLIGVTWPATCSTNNCGSWPLFDHDIFTNNTQEVVYDTISGGGMVQAEFRHVIFNQQVSASNPGSLALTAAAGGTIFFSDCYFNSEQIRLAGSVDLFMVNGAFENAAGITTTNFISQTNGTASLYGINFLQDFPDGTPPTEFMSSSGGSVFATNWRGVTQQPMATAFRISGNSRSIIFGSRGANGVTTDTINTSSAYSSLFNSSGAWDKLVLQGTMSGSITHLAPSVAGANTITDPATTGTTEVVIGSGSTTLGTDPLGAAGCETTITVPVTGVTSSSRITWSYASDPSAVAGYGGAPIDAIHIQAWPTFGNVNFKQCSSVPATPGAISILWNAFN